MHYPELFFQRLFSVLKYGLSLIIYPRETVVVEKLEAMAALGLTNSRMKNFHDIAVLATFLEFDGASLTKTLAATFRRRKMALPKEAPTALTAAFLDRVETKSLWKASVVHEAIEVRFANLGKIASLFRSFLLLPALAASNDESFEQFCRKAAPGNRCWVWAMLPVSLITAGHGSWLGELISFGHIINLLGRRNR